MLILLKQIEQILCVDTNWYFGQKKGRIPKEKIGNAYPNDKKNIFKY